MKNDNLDRIKKLCGIEGEVDDEIGNKLEDKARYEVGGEAKVERENEIEEKVEEDEKTNNNIKK